MRELYLVSTQPWNHWYHVVSHVYGSWLRGDPRGWRAVGHREHVEGDYRHPPVEGTYDQLHRLSRSLMKRDRVLIASELRGFVVNAVAEKLKLSGIEVLVVAVDATHLHLLGKFPDHEPRVWIGKAKKHASHLVRQAGLRVEEGGLWARRTRAEPIRDRDHQVNVFRYIDRHADRGAAIWRFDRKVESQ